MTFSRIFPLSTVALLGSALPALAQDAALCGGIGDGGQWIGGSEEASDIATAGAAVDLLTLVPRGGEATTLFTVSAPVEVRLEAVGQGGGDPVAELYDGAGNFVTSDDDSGGDRASRIETPLEPGTYCLQTSSFNGAIMMTEVRVGLAEHEPLTQGNINAAPEACTADTEALPLAEAPLETLLDSPVTISGSANAQPFYRFTLTAPEPLSITASNANADPVLTLYDGEGGLLGENDDFQGLDSRLDFERPLEPGDYCIGIRALSDANAPITVEVTRYDEQAILEATYATAESSPPLDGSYPVEALGTIDGRVRRDVRVSDTAIWFSFEITEPGLLLIEGVGDSSADPVLSLFDDFGRRVVSNDDYNGSLDSLIAERLFPGTYVLGVHQYSGSLDSAGTIRVMMERFVPVE